MIARYCAVLAVALSVTTTAIAADAKLPLRPGDETHRATQREEHVFELLRSAAAYPVTDVAGCLAGVNFAASLYQTLLHEGALDNKEYTKFLIESQLKFAIERGTPVDMYVFWLIFDMLRTNRAALAEVAADDGRNYAKQASLWEVIACKFNTNFEGLSTQGPIPKAVVTRLVENIIAKTRAAP